MQEFPKIKEGQVALIRVDPLTGHVLDDSFNLYLQKSDQQVYTVFKNLQTARDYANEFLNKTNQFEFTIYDHHDNFIECLSSYPPF